MNICQINKFDLWPKTKQQWGLIKGYLERENKISNEIIYSSTKQIKTASILYVSLLNTEDKYMF